MAGWAGLNMGGVWVCWVIMGRGAEGTVAMFGGE
jgi:hypothetical protein